MLKTSLILTTILTWPSLVSAGALDLDGDGVITEYDADRLILCLMHTQLGHEEEAAALYNLNMEVASGLVEEYVTSDDLVSWLNSISDLPWGWSAPWGDFNTDGVFDSADFIQAMARGEYEDGDTGTDWLPHFEAGSTNNNSGWGDGDINFDFEFSSIDLVYAMAFGIYWRTPPVITVVPEPNPAIMMAAMLLIGGVYARRA